MSQVQSAATSGSANMQRTPAELRPEGASKTQSQPTTITRSTPLDTVELSDASKALAWLVEQQQPGVELHLAPDKLRELAHG